MVCISGLCTRRSTTNDIDVGSYGSTPLPVLAAVNKLTMKIESNPDLFHRIEYLPLLIDVRRRLAQMIGANIDECVLVQNTSTGLNIILRNFEWKAGDVIIPCKLLSALACV